ncbi:15543_t:CDS:2, partial [Dentiscutata heterogama]
VYKCDYNTTCKCPKLPQGQYCGGQIVTTVTTTKTATETTTKTTTKTTTETATITTTKTTTETATITTTKTATKTTTKTTTVTKRLPIVTITIPCRPINDQGSPSFIKMLDSITGILVIIFATIWVCLFHRPSQERDEI